MKQAELFLMKERLRVLQDIVKEYSGRTIDNIIQQIESRIKHAEK